VGAKRRAGNSGVGAVSVGEGIRYDGVVVLPQWCCLYFVVKLCGGSTADLRTWGLREELNGMKYSLH
jgi:hypothetical protein